MCGAMARALAACVRKARLKAPGGQGTRGAHEEHAAHVRDLGRVEVAERLVELSRALPSQREGMRCGARYGPGGGVVWSGGGGGGGGGAGGMHEEQGTRGAHIEHGSHARDLRRIEAAKRLVERIRVLPSHNTGGRSTMRSECGPGGGRAFGCVGCGAKRCARRGSDSRLGGQGTSAQRTWSPCS